MGKPVNISKKAVDTSKLITLASYGLMLGLLIVTNILSPTLSLKLLVFQLIPLVILLPGLWRGHHRSYSWLCFVVLIYFTAYSVEVGSSRSEITDWLGLVLSIIMFIGGMLASRWIQHYNYNLRTAKTS